MLFMKVDYIPNAQVTSVQEICIDRLGDKSLGNIQLNLQIVHKKVCIFIFTYKHTHISAYMGKTMQIIKQRAK